MPGRLVRRRYLFGRHRIELLDGQARGGKYGFSWQDLVLDAAGTGLARDAETNRRLGSTRHRRRAPWAGAPALQPGRLLCAASAVRPEPRTQAR